MDLKKPAILSISLLTVMTNASVAPILGLISQSFPTAGQTLVTQVLTIPSLVMIVFSIISGQLVKVIPKKVVLALGLCIYLAGAAFSAASDSIAELIVFRALTGAGGGLIVPLASSLITDFYNGKERAKMIGYSSFTSYAGAAFAPLLAGWVAGEKWQNAFYIYFVALAVLVFTMLFVPFKPTQQKSAGHSPLKLNLPVLFMAFAGCAVYVIFYLMPSDVSFLIQKIEGGNATYAAALLAIEVIAAALAGVLFSQYTRKLNGRAFPLGFGLMAVGFFLIFVSSAFSLILVGMIIIGFGIGTLRPLIILRTSQVTAPGSMTSAFALVNSGFSLGQFISPFFYFAITSIFTIQDPSQNYLIAASIMLAAGVLSVVGLSSRAKRSL
jgi:MFS family permease